MSTLVGAAEASRVLGVTKATLYAYVSRGLVERTTAVDGRTSLYRREQLEQLARARAGRRRPLERPSIDVQIGSAITELSDDGLRYRDHDAAELARSCGFEAVAELLWTGELPSASPTWRVDDALAQRCIASAAAVGSDDPVLRLAAAACSLAGEASSGSGADAARHLLAIAPSLSGGPADGGVATRLAAAWNDEPGRELVSAIDRALVLLADHELATSTLGVRVACSVRCDPVDALATGLHIVRGPLHGAAARGAVDLLDDAASGGAARAVARRLDAGARLPGFGHSVYRSGDPRVAPLLEAVRAVPGTAGALAILDEVLAEAGRRIGQLPNVDLALGTLGFATGLPRDAPLFAIARLAGWAAHYDEERIERPVRFRGLTRHP